MKTCDTCGEAIAPQSSVCPFCETPQSPGPADRAAGPAVREIDLEAGLPTVAEALRRLAVQLERARADGVGGVRIIHGWGSRTGGGGKIRAAVRSWLQQQFEARRIRALVCGDEHNCTSPAGRDFLRRHPALQATERSDRRNPGITFVEP